jgi:hypothetical protein
VASLELRNQTFLIVFMFRGRKDGYSLDTGDRDTAEGLRGGVAKTLMRVEQNLLPFPEGADVVEFVKYDGRPSEKQVAPPAPLTLAQLRRSTLRRTGRGRWRPTAWPPCCCT